MEFLMSNPAIDLSGAKVLIVDDVPANLDVLYEALEAQTYNVLVATSGETALKVAARELPDLILLDVIMPQMDGFETCRRLQANPATQPIPVIFLTSRDDAAGTVEGFRVGAVDYIIKPFHQEEVLARIQTHLEHAFLTRALTEKNRQLQESYRQLAVTNQKLQEEMSQRQTLDNHLSMISRREAEHWGVDGFVGQSQTMQEILREINLLHNASTVSVLITGESGTGKELIARAIHAGSTRAHGPFVPVNCAAIPTHLAESLLFGHVKGAFTGADKDQTGYFELANGGTLFLDEIGTMPEELQPKLLRVLEDGLIRPLGANRDRRVDVRILAATNAPLEAFRQDLYFRLARFTVTVPPPYASARKIFHCWPGTLCNCSPPKWGLSLRRSPPEL
jgi:DNA-binding NtrC family response regulator